MAASERAAGRRFDRDRGVTTQAVLFLSQLGETNAPGYRHATHYEPVPVSQFRALVACLPGEVVRSSTFVDVGAGMGRAVLLASEYPFARILGIELSPGLFEIARANLAKAHELRVRCRDVRLVRADARRRRFPSGDLVVFLFNPFDEEALEAVLDRIGARERAISEWILYHTPVHGDRIEARGYQRMHASPAGNVYRLDRSRVP